MTISYIIPSLVGLDKTLENLATNYTLFNKALRTGLRSHFQDLMYQKDMILATVLDPRIKLQVETIAVDLICSIKTDLYSHKTEAMLFLSSLTISRLFENVFSALF